VRKPALSGGPPEQANSGTSQQQTKVAGSVVRSIQQPNAAHRQTGQGCPGTSETRLDCNTLSAIANVRQADAAERFNTLAGIEIGIGFATAIAAILAARWAKKAAEAGTKSYQAFVAAEDASLDIEFTDANEIESWTEGVQQPTTYFFTAIITNIGRSTARVHRCIVRGDPQNFIPVNKTLKQNESEALITRLDIGPLTIFEFQVSYATPIRPNAELVLKVFPTKKTSSNGGATITGSVIGRRIQEGRKNAWDESIKPRWWQRLWERA
jgi:hypothetical protein